MSQFYASIKGQARTEGTRRGSKKSGVMGHIRGWDIGVKVYASHREGKDYFEVYETGGSNDPTNRRLLVTFTDDWLVVKNGLQEGQSC